METQSNHAKTATYRPRRASLYWVDYLVIAATVLTFLAVVLANNPHMARAQTRANLISGSDLPQELSQLPEDPGLIKARIGLTTGHL